MMVVARKLIASRAARTGERKLAGYIWKHYLHGYVCTQGWLPAWFCPTSAPHFGVGYTAYAKTPVWTTSGVYLYDFSYLTALRLYCWTTGEQQSSGGNTTSLYYRVGSSAYVNDAWIFTGTDAVQEGVSHC